MTLTTSDPDDKLLSGSGLIANYQVNILRLRSFCDYSDKSGSNSDVFRTEATITNMTSDNIPQPTYFVVSTISLLFRAQGYILLLGNCVATKNCIFCPKYESIAIILPAADY